MDREEDSEKGKIWIGRKTVRKDRVRANLDLGLGLDLGLSTEKEMA